MHAQGKPAAGASGLSGWDLIRARHSIQGCWPWTTHEVSLPGWRQHEAGGVAAQMWWNALGRNGGCRRSNGQRGLVLDVGSNFGYYAIYVAAMGCRLAAPWHVQQQHAVTAHAAHVARLKAWRQKAEVPCLTCSCAA